MYVNHTTPQILPPGPNPAYIIAPLVLFALAGCAVAVIMYLRRNTRLDNLRHRLIPLYSYDVAEEHEWRDDVEEDEEEEEPTYRKGKLFFSPEYGT